MPENLYKSKSLIMINNNISTKKYIPIHLMMSHSIKYGKNSNNTNKKTKINYHLIHNTNIIIDKLKILNLKIKKYLFSIDLKTKFLIPLKI